MGEVYRARDTRLDRTVAVKILPSHLSEDPEAKQRFDREARSISSLNHPNICTLHDVGHQDGIDYLVMEYVQGETLDARLQKGPLPLKQALECGVNICDALEKAHRAGIVHRDLKPGNIMLTASGAKLLDFGLAKPVVNLGLQALNSNGNLTPSTPTMNLSMLSASPGPLTQRGTVVGTFQYMAPEVLQGQEADARSDIFSFGCVLYEMITGRRAFEGKTQLSVMTAILEKDPEPITTLQPVTPPALDYAVQACLEKNPDNRFQTAHDVKLQLAWISKTGSQAGAPAIAAGKSIPALWLAALFVIAVLAIALAAAFWPSQTSRRVVRANILPPPGAVFETLYRNGSPALSPDGTRLAFVARLDGKQSLWVRSLDELEATQLRGTEDAFFPFWSPDGTALAFFMQGKLWRMDPKGDPPVAICDAPEPRGGTWGRNNIIIFAPHHSGPLSQIPAAGGTPRPVTNTASNAGLLSDRWPFFLPDGKHFLFLHTQDGDADDRNEIRFASLDGGDEQIVSRGRYFTFQFVSGWLLADRNGALQAWKFDPSNGKLSGDAVQLVDKIASDDITAISVFSVSSQGVLLYQQGSGATGDRHIWADAIGKQLAQVSEPNVYGPARLSPDGSQISTPVLEQNGDTKLWVWDLAGGTRAGVSSGSGRGYADMSVWSADGRTLYFGYVDTDNHEEIRAVPTDGSRSEQTLIKAGNDTIPTDATSDGKWLLYEETKKEAPLDSVLKAFPLAKGSEPFTVIDLVSRNSNARLKPGTENWLAYQSKQSGRAEVYVTRFPHPGAKYQVSQSGGTQPVWSRDGKKLYYLDGNQKMTAVEVQTANESVQISPPKTLFQTSVRHSIPTGAYDVARDERFLLVNSVMETTAPMVIVTNWDAGLKHNPR